MDQFSCSAKKKKKNRLVRKLFPKKAASKGARENIGPDFEVCCLLFLLSCFLSFKLLCLFAVLDLEGVCLFHFLTQSCIGPVHILVSISLSASIIISHSHYNVFAPSEPIPSI